MSAGETEAWVTGVLFGIALAMIAFTIVWMAAASRKMKRQDENRRELEVEKLRNEVWDLKTRVSSIERSQRDRDFASRL